MTDKLYTPKISFKSGLNDLTSFEMKVLHLPTKFEVTHGDYHVERDLGISSHVLSRSELDRLWLRFFIKSSKQKQNNSILELLKLS